MMRAGRIPAELVLRGSCRGGGEMLEAAWMLRTKCTKRALVGHQGTRECRLFTLNLKETSGKG
eukprot:CAMPEP_0181179100 /NCGR_PEP_ID=MMETSP1096-20121128/6080_1 /TAXON_ID=156174 ORGANISM="Chrysochromulina ericina, Strain CCMP281" /NCGR_SAMPLE_ID=MMETSP1096 /ASSEMBLY_ACC=CAM_ASM_000453 /LENGTH=62 /DNA_ID=CAMNT_0023267427 /DNA_START=127 /DNA_END=315 /DNA_ORIENTATION=+